MNGTPFAVYLVIQETNVFLFCDAFIKAIVCFVFPFVCRVSDLILHGGSKDLRLEVMQHSLHDVKMNARLASLLLIIYFYLYLQATIDGKNMIYICKIED